jgi:tartrate dehydrogenase/decarboxylase / D-malate dehydrogenase
MLRIGLIRGDGIGPEVVDEAAKVIDAVADVAFETLPWGSEHWHETGTMMPADAIEQVRWLDAILLGAVGDPAVPDDVTLWGLLLTLRQGLDLWANIRPARLLPGIPSPLADASPERIDMVFVRENTEGEYAGIGGRAHRGLPAEVAVETAVFTRTGVERVVRYAFSLAQQRRRHLTSATKSNASRHGYTLWDEVVSHVSRDFPDVTVERVLVDALAMRLVRSPESLDVVVASNLFGDILTDVAAALQGGLGMCASANVAPGSNEVAIFEPVHGSAPDIAGRGIANPCGAIWSAALLLDHVGLAAEANTVMQALEETCAGGPRTRDVGGVATTVEVGEAVAARARELRSKGAERRRDVDVTS